jgi:predicted TIM-barrel fold metal-dependent hydrolase
MSAAATAGLRLIDCDNHYYEAEDAFTRHVPSSMRARCVEWAEVDGRKRHVVAGQVDYSVGNPTFDPTARPGILYDYYRGNPRGLPASEMMRGNLEPLPAAYRDPAARLACMDEQGIDAIWMFPTLGVLYEERLKHDVEAVCATFSGFNRWLFDDWRFNYADRIFAAPYLSLADVAWACRELDWALAQGARIAVMRPAAAFTRDGARSPADPCFDPFWARLAESGVPLVIHTGNSGYSSNGYANDEFSRASIGMSRRPSVKGLALERAAGDFLLTLSFENLFERFPRLRVVSVENGSQFLPSVLHHLSHAQARNPWHFKEDPVALFREHVYVNPFWEDDLREVIEWIGAERVLFGSDWPHMEGLPDPAKVLDDLEGIDPATCVRYLRENTRSLMSPPRQS